MINPQQVIIKKVKKVSGGGHHGGAWKVAYADFVTAMMAFFLLMWLLNATTEDQRKGIADYFNPTIPVSPISGGGKDVLNGSSVFAEDTHAKDGTGGAKTTGSREEKSIIKDTNDNIEVAHTVEDADAKAAALDQLNDQLLNRLNEERTKGLAQHIQTRVTPEGLVIELVDIDGSPLFELGSTRASATMNLILGVVTKSLRAVNNDISIVGHTDGRPYSGNRNYSNWELSTDRAHIARRLMIDTGLPLDQISEVAGKADTDPLVDDKLAPQNRRISIIILRN
ncbi:MAG: OmpA family protein [Marinicaulis sp.]|nr:OmpA family protein [Marinicaulis sp.]